MAETAAQDTLTVVKPESLFSVDTMKRWWAKRSYPGFLDSIPPTLSTTDVSRSAEDYLKWLTDKNVQGYATEPGRSAIWGHVTSARGIDNIVTTGFLRSAKKVLTEGGSIGHGAGGKVKRILDWYKISPNATLRELSPELQTEILSTVDDDVAGTLGHLCQEFSVPADIDVVSRDQVEEKTEDQYALIYPVDYLLKRYGRLYLPGEQHNQNDTDPYGMWKLNKNRDMLRILPYHSVYARPQDWEYQIVTDVERGTEVSLAQGLIFVPDTQVDRVKAISSAADRTIPIVAFPTIFQGINQAAGWLTNSPEGRYFFKKTTGVDPLDVALHPVSRQEVEWAIINLRGALRRLGASRVNLTGIPDALSRVEARTNYYEGILEDMKDVFKVDTKTAH